MPRFVVWGPDEIEEKGWSGTDHDPEDLAWNFDDEWSFNSYLIDTKKEIIVASDFGEPEDKCFGRNYDVFVDLLNKVDQECGKT